MKSTTFKRIMEKVIPSPIVPILLTVIIIVFLSFQNGQLTFKPVVSYPVRHSQEEWQAELDTLRMIQNVIGYPLTREVSDQYQSVLIRMQQRITSQVQPQLQEEARREAAKKDSTSHKK